MIKTELCEIAGIKYPIVQAGMGPWQTEKLAIASANAGILGMISASGLSAAALGLEVIKEPDATEKHEGTSYEIIQKIIRNVASATRESKGIFGVNCMVSQELSTAVGEIIKGIVDVREEDPDIKDRLRVIITSAGDPVAWADSIKPVGIKWFHVVPSVRHAKRCEKAGVDVIIASGHEGGGHTAWEPVHSMVLLPAITNAVKTPVIGAGGFCDGATLVAALALGACGVQMGTRFIATQESAFGNLWKNRVIKSGERDSLPARGFVGPLRYLKNDAAMELGELTLRKTPRLYLGEPDASLDDEIYKLEDQGMKSLSGDDDERGLFYGGEAAGRIDDLPPVAELVQRIVTEAENTISSMPKFLQS